MVKLLGALNWLQGRFTGLNSGSEDDLAPKIQEWYMYINRISWLDAPSSWKICEMRELE